MPSFWSLFVLGLTGVARCGCTPPATPVDCTTANLVPAIPGIEMLSVSASAVTNYTFIDPGIANATAADYFDFCNVTLIFTHPGWHDSVTVITYLPTHWNGRFLALGGGGMAAGGEALLRLQSTITPMMRRRFAISTTDGGHPSDLDASVDVNPPWVLKSPGNVDLAMLLNFASRSLHDIAVLGKAVAARAYGRQPSFSYFLGESTGGQQGHMLAQRYPEDFDGIVANKPVVNWVRSLFSNVWAKLIMDTAGAYPTRCELDALTARAVEVCDELDGVRDGIISRPGLCDFDPRPLAGTSFDCGGKSATFSNISVQVARAVHEGPRSPDGKFRWFGFGKDVGLDASGTGPAALVCPESPATGPCSAPAFHMSDLWLRYFYAKDPTLDLTTITRQRFDDLFLEAVNEYESIIGTADPDLSRFRRAGGKMLSWHGMMDQLVPTNSSTHYYDRVLVEDPRAQDFYRMFLAPGADHAGMGIAPAEADCVDYIMDWVEKGQANETLRASGMTGTGETAERNICMYPRVQHYRGGNSSLPLSFICT